jgi:hypothetical protein
MLRSMSIVLLAFLVAAPARAGKDTKTVPLPELTARALGISKLTQAGSHPFHLKAVVTRSDSRDTAYEANIEEYWVAADKWRRSVKTREFSQELIVNGDKVLETDSGSYDPFWLRDIITALFEVVPPEFTPRNIPVNVGGLVTAANFNARQELDTPGQVSLAMHSGVCQRWEDEVGTLPARNEVFTTVCFGEQRRFAAVSTPYYNAKFLDYGEFGQKQIAHRIKVYLGPDVNIEAKITKLSELKSFDESLFAILQPTPETDRVRSVRVTGAQALKSLLGSPEIAWAPVPGGKTSGALSIAVYVDREGNVRETRPLYSDNPYAQEQARKVVSQWRFNPLQWQGAAAQMETLLTFRFQTTIANSFPRLSNAQARKLAISKPEASFPHGDFPKGMEYAVRITVDEKGIVTQVDNVNNVAPALFQGAKLALAMWFFRPYKIDGKPHTFTADILFHVR